MGAPSPELSNLWLARAFNEQDVEAAAALYHPEAAVVQLDDVHGGSRIVRGADGIRATMAAYINLKPHMDVVTHHVTQSGDFAMTRSQWLITGKDTDGNPVEVHHHGMEVHRRGEDGTWYFFLDHPLGADPFWAVPRPPRTIDRLIRGIGRRADCTTWEETNDVAHRRPLITSRPGSPIA